MGLIRKAASISTLGIVSFRSSKEQLRRAEKHRRAADLAELKASGARRRARRRMRKAAKRASAQAEDHAEREISLVDRVVDLTIAAPRASDELDEVAVSAD
ncbi:MAG: hypothetical protein WD691_04345 [Acidimicrobiales bacterium]